jgi:3-isopropylmalate/(R)-2-methylmalate dehydratase large subunit
VSPAKRIPTKKELERLQRLYKTDERIAERLNVTEHLVGYWRRKRNVPIYSAPKFPEQEIRTLWERFGNDDRCGAELGISRAAFYNWRRKYEIREKPAFLKLEQMEFQFPGKEFSSLRAANYGKRSATHKLLWEKRDGRASAIGERVTLTPDLLALGDKAQTIVSQFEADGAQAVFSPDKIAMGIHHPAGFNGAELKPRTVGDWSSRSHIRYRISLKDGVLWDALQRQGALLPGILLACSRGRERFAGALGAFGWGLSDPELVELLRVGELHIDTPAVSQVILTGKRYLPINATDIMLHLLSLFGDEAISETALEFTGSSVRSFPIADREALCSLTALSNVRTAIFPTDAITKKHFATLGSWNYTAVSPDKDAEYEGAYQLNIEMAQPMVGWISAAQSTEGAEADQSALDLNGNNPDSLPATSSNSGSALRVSPVEDLSGKSIYAVYIGGSPGGGFDELRRAAEVLRGNTVAESTLLLVSPRCPDVYLQALKKGLLRQFIEAGAIVVQPGLDLSALYPLGVPADMPIATTQIEADSLIVPPPGDRYIVSPATAAACAVRGALCDPRGV